MNKIVGAKIEFQESGTLPPPLSLVLNCMLQETEALHHIMRLKTTKIVERPQNKILRLMIR